MRIGNHDYEDVNAPVRAGSAPYRVRGRTELIMDSGQFGLSQVIVHNSGNDAPNQTAEWLANWAATGATDYPQAPYHAYIERSGRTVIFHPIGTLAWHADGQDRKEGMGGNNWRGYGIGLEGKFDAYPPNGEQFNAAVRLIRDLLIEFRNIGITRAFEIVRHKDVYVGTACPGLTSDNPNGWWPLLKAEAYRVEETPYKAMYFRLLMEHGKLLGAMEQVIQDAKAARGD